MPKLERTDGELSPSLRQSAILEAFVHESAVQRGTVTDDIRITRVTIEYEMKRAEKRPERTHRDFGPRLPRSHDEEPGSGHLVESYHKDDSWAV